MLAMIGPDGLRVEVIALDRGGGPKPWLKVTRGGALVSRGYYRTVAELARVIDLAVLEDCPRTGISSASSGGSRGGKCPPRNRAVLAQ